IASPHTTETDHLIGKQEFALLPRGAWFINIGRGAVVDEAELIARLEGGHIAHAALDVFAVEPLPTESPLWDMDNVIISPHCSANAPRENERIVQIFIRNLHLYLDGRIDDMSPVLDKARLY
ncbi:MAG TPA: NAD(P)-dependent oxidoreductase, partial [Thermomicrobiales bacterium]|nr:NAD(P)-dependent oxidoreductase [Thermomicrobiales bacterium]